jgi:hypothetical protein
MKRRTLALLLGAPALATAVATLASATPAGASVPVHGPYLISTPFETTCGSQAGLVLGSFTASVPPANADGSYDLQIKLTGTFVTLAGPSIAACNPTTAVNSGRTIREGVSGSFVSGGVFHLTSAAYTGTASCLRDQNSSCDIVAYLHSAYGSGVVFNQTSVHATLHSNAPRLIKRQLTESCSGAACASNQLTITGDIASGHAP